MRQASLNKIIGNQGIFVDGDWVESKDQDPNGDIRLIQLADIGDGIFINKSNRYLTSEKAKELKCTFLEQGDLLIARMPDPLGRACIFPQIEIPCVTVVDVCIVRPDKNIVSSEWLKLLINSHGFRKAINKYITGTTRQRISRGNLEKIKFDIPPLEDQERIVKIFDQAEALRKNRKQAIGFLDDYLTSVFLEMFGDPVNNPKRWTKQKFKKLGTLDRGKSKHRPRNAPELLGGNHPLIQTGDIANADVYIEKYNSTYSDIGLKQSKKWPKGTLCITIAANIAKTGILKIDACFPDSVVGFTADTNKTNSIFIHFWMSFFQKILESNAPESAQKNINLRILRELEVVNPPLELQNKFSEIVEKTESLKQKMLVQYEELEKQFQALMQKAFNGTL
ncbi:MAG TPA: restriction endonuclease subunit S [Smithellaceae bacterium]|nr:restriction endonuclease subunit S [Smithellaceae bacterium]